MEKSQYSILCIEDNQIVREKLVELLRSFFHTVYSASSAEEAIPLYQRNKPEIILTDINLPGISGMDLAKKIREKDLSTKVIILTAHMSDELLLAASELKLTKYLLKPVTYKALKEALKLAIDELESIEIVYKKLIYLKEGYVWNVKNSELFSGNKLVTLTKKERMLLELFFANKNTLISYEKLLGYAWLDSESATVDVVKSAIKKLRRKLPENTIINIYGEGYKLEIN